MHTSINGYRCIRRGEKSLRINERFFIGDVPYCREHYIEKKNKEHQIKKPTEMKEWEHHFDIVNKPEHYHKYEMDTITFLEKGFRLK